VTERADPGSVHKGIRQISREKAANGNDQIYNNSKTITFKLYKFLLKKAKRDGYEDKRHYTYNLLESLALYKGRLYFLMRKNYTDYKTMNLQIWSVNISNPDQTLEKYDLGEFGVRNGDRESEYNRYCTTHVKMIYHLMFNHTKGKIESAYSTGSIYVRDTSHIVRFDLETLQISDCDESASSLFESPYVLSENDGKYTITNSSSGEQRDFYLNDIINNSCGGALAQLKDKKIMFDDSSSYLDNFDYFIWGYINGELYFTFSVLNYWGETVPVNFKYDFENNKFYFLFAGRKGDTLIARNSYLIPYIT